MNKINNYIYGFLDNKRATFSNIERKNNMLVSNLNFCAIAICFFVQFYFKFGFCHSVIYYLIVN